MNCRDLSEFLQDYFAGDLPDQVSAEFSVHLHACNNCTVFIEQYRQTIQAGRMMAECEALPTVPEELVRAIIEAMKAAE